MLLVVAYVRVDGIAASFVELVVHCCFIVVGSLCSCNCISPRLLACSFFPAVFENGEYLCAFALLIMLGWVRHKANIIVVLVISFFILLLILTT